MRTTFALLTAVMLALASLPGCASQTPQDTTIRQVAILGGLIALDVDALKHDGATPDEKLTFQAHVEQVIALVGAGNGVGAELSRLLSEYVVTGHFQDDAWRTVLRTLLEWAASNPTTTP